MADVLAGFTGTWWATADEKKMPETRKTILRNTAAGAAFIGPGSTIWFDQVLGRSANLPEGSYTLPLAVAGVAAGAGLWWLAARKGTLVYERVKGRLLKTTPRERETKTDIRKMEGVLPKPGRDYNPEDYFKQGEIFMGLDEDGKPIYIPYPGFGKHRHTQASGTTGAGKGVACGIYGAQCIRHGEAVVIFDPKDDEWAPHLYRAEAERAGREFAYIDLRQRVPQLQILAAASADDTHALLVAGASLEAGGTDADYHKRAGRVMARRLLDRIYAANPNPTLRDVWEMAKRDEEAVKDAKGLVDALEEAASGGQLSAAIGGLDLAAAIEAGAVIYIQGGTQSDVAIMQRMMLVRIGQICAARNRVTSTPRQVMVFLDEVKVLLSATVLDAMAMWRDKGVHLVLAHQSLGDFRQVPGLDPEAIKGAIIENCKQRFLYGVGDSDTAAWLAANSGKILIDDEAKKFDANAALVEQSTGERTLRIADRFRVDENMWLGMADDAYAGMAVCVAKGYRFVHLCPLKVSKRRITLTHVGQLTSQAAGSAKGAAKAGEVSSVDF
jgi:hypothetical protein